MKKLSPSFNKKFGLINGLHPTEGWGIFFNTENLTYEVQRIDEERKLGNDDEALALAKKKGMKFNDETNIYAVYI